MNFAAVDEERPANKTELMLKIKPLDGGPWLIESFEGFKSMFMHGDQLQEQYVIQPVFMSKKEIEALPEFTGW